MSAAVASRGQRRTFPVGAAAGAEVVFVAVVVGEVVVVAVEAGGAESEFDGSFGAFWVEGSAAGMVTVVEG